MYRKTEKKSIATIIDDLKDDKLTFEQARLNLGVSRLGVDKMIGAEIEKTTLMHMSSLSAHDIETKQWKHLDLSDSKVAEFARWVRTWNPEMQHGLFIYGIPGNAKTHMIKSLILHHCSPSYRFYFTTVSSFMSTARDYVKEYCHAKHYVTHLIDNYHAIVLDDLGTEKTSDFSQEVLFELIEGLGRENKRIFMTSNLSIDELKDRYKDPVVSRIGQHTIALENDSPSYRKTQHKNNLEMYRERVKILPRN